nr:MAG TPA: hypothetical protein [Caudoviricetes sp.]
MFFTSENLKNHVFMRFSALCKKIFYFMVDKSRFMVYFYFLLYITIVSKDYSYI